MVKLKRLKIQRYRNVEPCELRFSDRFNVLLGPNGAGKTTLLNLVSRVLSSNLAEAGDPFSVEMELVAKGGTLSGSIEHTQDSRFSAQEIEAIDAVSGAMKQGIRAPEVKLHLEHLDSPLVKVDIDRARDGMRMIVNGVPRVDTLPFQMFELDMSFLGLLELLVGSVALTRSLKIVNDLRGACRFDESLDVFRALTAREDDPGLVFSELRPRIAGKKAPNGATNLASVEGLVPNAIGEVVKKQYSAETTTVALEPSHLRFLSETKRLLGLSAVRGAFELTGKQVDAKSNSDVFEFGNLKFWFTRRDGSIFQDQHLSYGQKRLLAFLYYLDCNPSFVIADELVNGLHHAWIEECVAAIGDRQAFLTSQNPLLLDYLSFESVEQVKETFILCRTEPDGDRDKMIWRNMTDDEADMFYPAYKVGIEHVGEILRTRGLW